MKNSRDRIHALWCRQLSGEELNDAESQLLKDALREDSDLVLELSDDATWHALLLSLEDVVQTEDAFVQAVMQSGSRQDSRPSEKAETLDEFRYREQCLETEPASSEHESPGLPMVADAQSGSSTRREYSRQRSQQRVSLLLTVVLFVSVGLIFWFQGQGQPEFAGTGSSPDEHEVEPTPSTPLQGDQPESVNDRNVAATDDVSPAEGETSEDAINSPLRIATNDNVPEALTPVDDLGSSGSLNMTEETLPAVASRSFATFTKVENPVWERKDTVGSRLGNDVVRLFGGMIELTFDDGAIVTLEGPVEFQPRTAALLDLRRGRLSATVPRPAIGFTVQTPTSEVVDLGTEFDVSVRDTGASDVIVRKGEIEVAPGGRNGKDIQKWKLVPGGLNHASFYARSDNGKPGPIVAKVQGALGQFHGVISIDGKTAKFRSEDTFNNVHERVMTQLKISQNGMTRQWQEFVDSMQEKMRGTMNFNGRQMQFGSLDEVMRLHNQLRNQPNIDAGTPFSGSININGKVIQFKTREEFEAARRAAFGPAANFGAGDIFDRQRRPE